MGTRRSIRDVAKQLGRDDAHVFRWSSRHSWLIRAHAFDGHNDRLKREADARGRLPVLERQIESAMALQKTATEALARVEASMLTTMDGVRWLDVGIRLELLSRGVGNLDTTKAANQAFWDRLGGPELCDRSTCDRHQLQLTPGGR